MRIISGMLRGKNLCTPSDERIRPTSDKARGALFNILFSKLEKNLCDCSVLDVFSGTGAVGLEAASRGAKEVTFVDIDLSLTKKNATLCKFSNLKFIQRDAQLLPYAQHFFDIIFMDAPYKCGLSIPTLLHLKERGYISLETFIVVETANDETLNLDNDFLINDERIYGAAKFHFLTVNR